MKKMLVVVAVLVVVAAAGAVLYVYQPFAEVITPAQLLPKETLVVVEAMNVKKSLDEFRNGPMGQALSKIDIPACMVEMGASPGDIGRVEEMQTRLNAALESPWFDTLFGDLVSIAVLPPDLAETAVPSEKMVKESVVMVLRPKKPAEMIQWIGKMLPSDVTITPETIEGIRMDRIQPEEGPPLYSAVHRGLGLLAFDPAPIIRCAAPPSGDGASLVDVPRYGELRAELVPAADGRFFAYADLERLIALFFEAAARYEADEQSVAEAREMWGGFADARPVVGIGTTETGESILHNRWVVLYDRDALPPHLLDLWVKAPEKNDTLARIPADPIYYSWQNNLKQILLASLDAAPMKAAEKEAMKQTFERQTGVPFDDAVNAIGDQFAILMRDLLTGGMFPVPELALMIQVNQPEVIHRLADAALQNVPVPLETETVGDTSIRYAVLPYGEDISPCYACADGFCTISVNRRLMKEILGTKPESGGLMESAGFKALDKGLSEPNNQMAYMDWTRGIGKTRTVIKWAISFAMMSGKVKDPNQLRFLNENLIEPLVEGLSHYKAFGFRSIIQKDRIQSDAYIQKAPAS